MHELLLTWKLKIQNKNKNNEYNAADHFEEETERIPEKNLTYDVSSLILLSSRLIKKRNLEMNNFQLWSSRLAPVVKW